MEKTITSFDLLAERASRMLVESVKGLNVNLNFPNVKQAKGHGKPNINTPRGAFYNHSDLNQDIDFKSLRK